MEGGRWGPNFWIIQAGSPGGRRHHEPALQARPGSSLLCYKSSVREFLPNFPLFQLIEQKPAPFFSPRAWFALIQFCRPMFLAGLLRPLKVETKQCRLKAVLSVQRYLIACTVSLPSLMRTGKLSKTLIGGDVSLIGTSYVIIIRCLDITSVPIWPVLCRHCQVPRPGWSRLRWWLDCGLTGAVSPLSSLV